VNTEYTSRACVVSVEGDQVGQRYARQPIAADAGFIRAEKGGGTIASGGASRRLSGADVSAAASKFLNPDGSAFYPGGTSWCAFETSSRAGFSFAPMIHAWH
jgi:hypothetical protein